MTNRIIFMGTPQFSVPCLATLIEHKYDVIAVYTQQDKQAGRGQKLIFSPVKEFALSHNLQVLQPVSLRNEEEIKRLKELNPDVVVVAAYGKLIPESMLSIPKFGFLNIHPSLLPRHRGASPIQTAILSGDKVTGVSIMLLDSGMDSGPVFKQKELAISDSDTAVSISEKLSHLGAELIIEVLPLWIEGRIKPVPQDGSKATYTRVLEKEDGKIDWSSSAIEIWRKIRAFNPWPACFTYWQGKYLKIIEAVPLSDSVNISSLAGTVISLPEQNRNSIGIKCGEGILRLIRLQLEGKKEMTAEEFARGQRSFIGSRLL